MRLNATRRIDLALHALQVLATDPGVHHGRDLAARIRTSTSFLPQIMAPMVRVGWIRTTPGPHGGYHLGSTGSLLTLLDLVEVVDGPLEDGTCFVRNGRCTPEDRCALHDVATEVRRTLVELLRAHVVLPAPATTPGAPLSLPTVSVGSNSLEETHP